MKKFSIFLFSLFVISFGFWHTAFGATNEIGKAQSNSEVANVQANVQANVDVTSIDLANILGKIDRTNEQIQVLIDKALVKTSEITMKLESNLSTLENEKLTATSEDITKINATIKSSNEEANAQIAIIMRALISETDKIANDMVIEAEKYGIIVINEYIPYKINGIVYLVDPLRVGRS